MVRLEHRRGEQLERFEGPGDGVSRGARRAERSTDTCLGALSWGAWSLRTGRMEWPHAQH